MNRVKQTLIQLAEEVVELYRKLDLDKDISLWEFADQLEDIAERYEEKISCVYTEIQNTKKDILLSLIYYALEKDKGALDKDKENKEVN